MKLIIDIPEENYKEMCGYGNDRVDFDLKRMIQNGTPIPDNATNGDVIKAMFSNAKIKHQGGGILRFIVDEWSFQIAEDWWNRLYQKRGKE